MTEDNPDSRTANGLLTNSRRSFVAGSAGALGGLSIGGGFMGSAFADGGDNDADGENDEQGEGDGPMEMPEDDLEFPLEHL